MNRWLVTLNLTLTLTPTLTLTLTLTLALALTQAAPGALPSCSLTVACSTRLATLACEGTRRRPPTYLLAYSPAICLTSELASCPYLTTFYLTTFHT